MCCLSDDKVRADIKKGALQAYSFNGAIRIRYADALAYGRPVGSTSTDGPVTARSR